MTSSTNLYVKISLYISLTKLHMLSKNLLSNKLQTSN